MKKILNYIILFFALFFNRLEYFLKQEFDSPSFEQILFHLNFAGEQVDFDIDILYIFLKRCFLIPSLVLLVVYFITRFSKLKIKNLYLVIFNVVLLITAILLLLNRISFFDTFKNENYIDQNYVNTSQVKSPTKKDNLIIIYIESLENSYREKSLFQKNLLENLDNKTKDWLSFKEYSQNYGGNYTIAAIVSTQCGIPLRPTSWYNKKIKKEDMIGQNEIGILSENFLPNAVCLGDILKKDGYSNIFLGGADPVFAGKGKFLKQHGYDTIIGRPQWKERGETEMNGWGLYDDILFKNAKLELDKVYSTGKPFNFTVLTVDTHHPNGHLSTECKKRGAEKFPGIVECTGNLVVDFLNHIESKGYMKNTNIIIVGDHLAMNNTEIRKLKSLPKRNIYNKIYSINKVTPNRDRIYQISMFPTILELLNYEVPTHKLGLGASGISPKLAENYSVETEKGVDNYLTETLRSKSVLFKHFWGEATD